jgi:putative cardiolipin synthase
VRLKDAEGRNLEWVRLENGAAVEVIDTEPGTDLWTRMKLYFQSIVIPESLL